jgi:hypothetical protein
VEEQSGRSTPRLTPQSGSHVSGDGWLLAVRWVSPSPPVRAGAWRGGRRVAVEWFSPRLLRREDCQAFAHFLGRPDVLDPAGGTDVFQMAPARVKFTDGTDDEVRAPLRARAPPAVVHRLLPTPIGNTAERPGFPIAVIIPSFMDYNAGRRSRDEVRRYVASSTGPRWVRCPADAPPRRSFRALAVQKMLSLWVRGLARP